MAATKDSVSSRYRESIDRSSPSKEGQVIAVTVTCWDYGDRTANMGRRGSFVCWTRPWSSRARLELTLGLVAHSVSIPGEQLEHPHD